MPPWNGPSTKADAIRKIRRPSPSASPRRNSPRERSPATWNCTSNKAAPLEKSGTPIGVVVEGIRSNRFVTTVEVTGSPINGGHHTHGRERAGRTGRRFVPHRRGQRNRGAAQPGRQVGTVGQAQRQSERAEHRARAPSSSSWNCADLLSGKKRSKASPNRSATRGRNQIATQTRTRIEMRGPRPPPRMRRWATPDVQRSIEAARPGSSALPTWRDFPSGAGHDAQMMSLLGSHGP